LNKILIPKKKNRHVYKVYLDKIWADPHVFQPKSASAKEGSLISNSPFSKLHFLTIGPEAKEKSKKMIIIF